MKTWHNAGTLVKTKNLKGELVMRVHTSFSSLESESSSQGFKNLFLVKVLEPGIELFFIPPQHDVRRSAHISSVRQLSDKEYLLSFDEVDNRAEAELLVGLDCLIDAKYLKAAEEELALLGPYGFEVETADGLLIGKVTELIENPGQVLLEVKGDKKVHLIPFVDAFVVSVLPEEKRLVLDLPQGLLEL